LGTDGRRRGHRLSRGLGSGCPLGSKRGEAEAQWKKEEGASGQTWVRDQGEAVGKTTLLLRSQSELLISRERGRGRLGGGTRSIGKVLISPSREGGGGVRAEKKQSKRGTQRGLRYRARGARRGNREGLRGIFYGKRAELRRYVSDQEYWAGRGTPP